MENGEWRIKNLFTIVSFLTMNLRLVWLTEKAIIHSRLRFYQIKIY